jgi:hypothetical protein
MGEIACAFAWTEGGNERADSAPETRNRPFGCLSQKSFELGERHFDWVEVWRIARQVAQSCAGGLNGFAYPGDFVSFETVNDNDVAGFEHWNKTLLKVGEEDFAVHGPLDQERGDDPIVTKLGHKGEGLPMRLGPPLDFAAALPVATRRWTHLTAELALTSKSSAASRLVAPLSTASTTRSRKSWE